MGRLIRRISQAFRRYKESTSDPQPENATPTSAVFSTGSGGSNTPPLPLSSPTSQLQWDATCFDTLPGSLPGLGGYQNMSHPTVAQQSGWPAVQDPESQLWTLAEDEGDYSRTQGRLPISQLSVPPTVSSFSPRRVTIPRQFMRTLRADDVPASVEDHAPVPDLPLSVPKPTASTSTEGPSSRYPPYTSTRTQSSLKQSIDWNLYPYPERGHFDNNWEAPNARDDPEWYYQPPRDDRWWDPVSVNPFFAGEGGPDSSAQSKGQEFEIEERRDCAICAEAKPVRRFPQSMVADGCTHLPEACSDCLRMQIKTQMESNQFSDSAITCPQCSSPMNYAAVRLYADRGTFSRYALVGSCPRRGGKPLRLWCLTGRLRRYESRLTDSTFSSIPNFFRCVNSRCDSGQIHDSGDAQPIVTCIGCKTKACFRHGVLWHRTMSCEEYDGFLADPDSFKSKWQRENDRVEREIQERRAQREAQEDMDREYAQLLMDDEGQREAALRHQEQEQRARQEKARQEAERRAAELRAEQERRDKIKREADNMQQTMRTIQQTTKNCPGCSAPIEKRSGW